METLYSRRSSEASLFKEPTGGDGNDGNDGADISAHHYSETADFQRMRASRDEAITQGVSKVLVIYTGGTIGMKNDKYNGYSPVKGYLPKKLRSIDRFHDPKGFRDFEIGFQRSDSLNHNSSAALPGHSNPAEDDNEKGQSADHQPASASALLEMAKQRLREMARGHRFSSGSIASGNCSAFSDSQSAKKNDSTMPLAEKTTRENAEGKVCSSNSRKTSKSDAVINKENIEQAICKPCSATESVSELPSSASSSSVVSSSPLPHSRSESNKDVDVAANLEKRQDDAADARGKGTPSRLSEWLITPRSLYGRRVQYCFLEYDPLLDSCNMDMTDWVRIVTDIERFYYTFDAFIILHGTDTMSYTASALSFMLQNLGKSVIVTGSQVPIAEVRNDGIENFLGALTIAGHFVIPEVTLYFNNKLFRGNRCIKSDAMDFDAFSSPNLAPLVKVGVDFEVNWAEVLRPNAIEPFCAHKQMESNVATLRLFPGITASAVRAFLAPPIQGIVLETYGAGNAPDARPAILEALTDASERGVVIVNVTQCQRGNVSDLYATARGLTTAKVVPGRDMTSECALTKLSYLLGRGLSPERCRELLGRSLRGELAVIQSHSRPIFSSGNGRLHTFTQFVSCQILDETQANEPNIEPSSHNKTPAGMQSATALRISDSIHASNALANANANTNSGRPANGSRRLAEASSHISLSSEASSIPRSRETVNERASIYRSFFPVMLCAAAATGDLQGMYMLEAASNNALEVTCYDYTGQTPLHSAVRAGQLPCARFLLKRGASVHVLSRKGHTPLFEAIYSRHPEMVNLLIQAGAHFSDAEIRDLMLSMQHAVSRGDIEFVKIAVRAGFDVNASDHEGRTILYFAVISGQVEIVQYLLALPGVSIDHWDHWGYSPMDYVLRKLDLWNEFGAPHEDSLHDMQHICSLFSEMMGTGDNGHSN
ncbi:hypothetical protein LPJ64_003832 [Coemansia asiatica]|uniref:asparaginase n=1 Tax=Coemansia asiatica TaxID=1052880 RepID=A0A9W8CHU9_9FUNG|nr:hypothetical protein LPJ64_003832 [Coemansia asiatica]